MSDDMHEIDDSLSDEEKAEQQMRSDLRKFADLANNPHSGIAEKVLAAKSIDEGKKSLSKKQRYHYDNTIEPSLLEGCAFKSCSNLTRIGHDYCAIHEIEFPKG
jgi:hypothetical protein